MDRCIQVGGFVWAVRGVPQDNGTQIEAQREVCKGMCMGGLHQGKQDLVCMVASRVHIEGAAGAGKLMWGPPCLATVQGALTLF